MRSDTTAYSLQQICVKQEAPIKMCLPHTTALTENKNRQQLATPTPTDMPNECNTRHDKVSSALLKAEIIFRGIGNEATHHVLTRAIRT